MKALLLTYALLLSFPALAAEDYYGKDIPFVSKTYCINYLKHFHAAATIKEGLEALTGISSFDRVRTCTEDLVTNWNKYPSEFEKQSEVTPRNPLFYEKLSPKEKAKTLLAHSFYISHYSFLQGDSFFRSKGLKFQIRGNEGVIKTPSHEMLVTLKPPLADIQKLLPELRKHSFSGDEIKKLITEWKKKYPELHLRKELGDLLTADYKDRKLLAYYNGYLNQGKDPKAIESFCKSFEHDQNVDREFFKVHQPIYHIGSFRFRTDKEWAAAAQGLTEGQYISMIDYTGEYYSTINKTLRTQGPLPRKEDVFVKAAKLALEKLPKHEGKVLRMADLPPSVLEKHKEGEIVTYDAFTSTSRDPNWTWAGAHRFVIFSKTKGSVIGSAANNPAEDEVLFPPGAKFKILKRTEGESFPGEMHFIMAEVDDNGNVIADVPPEELK